MDYSAANTALWNFIIQMGLIAGAVMLANILRRKIALICRGLMPIAVMAGSDGAPTAKSVGFKSGAIIVGTYLVQGVMGLAITLLLLWTVMPDMFQAAGLLLPMGFGQGPGQANNVGTAYQALGFAGGRSFGLAIAAAGYLAALTAVIVRKKK